jgi:repressor LexA
VVALVNDEVTVKRFYPQGKIIELRPANKTMKPIRIPTNQITIQGVVIGLQRIYD